MEDAYALLICLFANNNKGRNKWTLGRSSRSGPKAKKTAQNAVGAARLQPAKHRRAVSLLGETVENAFRMIILLHFLSFDEGDALPGEGTNCRPPGFTVRVAALDDDEACRDEKEERKLK